MHPILKCCGIYCSCILVISFVFYGILIALVATGNPWLTREFRHDIDSKVEALVLALIVNAVCLVGCVACTAFGRWQEIKEQRK